MRDNERIDKIKDEIVSTLGLPKAEGDMLQGRLIEIRTERPGLKAWGLVLLIGAIFLLALWGTRENIGPWGWAVILFLWLWNDLLEKVTSIWSRTDKQVEALAQCVARWMSSTYIKEFEHQIALLEFKSQRETESRTNFYVAIPQFNKRYEFSTGYTSRDYSYPIEKRSYSRSDSDYQLTSSCVIGTSSVDVRIKCDFRVVRDPFTQKEVEKIFESVLNLLPFASADSVSIKQWSTSREIGFDKTYLESGQLQYLHQKRRRLSTFRGLQNDVRLTKQDSDIRQLPLFGAGAEKAVGQPRRRQEYSSTLMDSQSHKVFHASRVSSARLNRFAKKRKRRSITLAELVEKRRQSERIAMETTRQYEVACGRRPEDVSARKIGFDILSQCSQTSDRRIEVKGLSAKGDVLLTENEVTTAAKFPDSFYVYIVDNCSFGGSSRTLYIKKGLEKDELQKQIVAYEFSLDEQDSAGSPRITL